MEIVAERSHSDHATSRGCSSDLAIPTGSYKYQYKVSTQVDIFIQSLLWMYEPTKTEYQNNSLGSFILMDRPSVSCIALDWVLTEYRACQGIPSAAFPQNGVLRTATRKKLECQFIIDEEITSLEFFS